MRKVDMQMRRDRCDVVYFIYYLFIYLSIYFAVVWLVAGLYVHIYLILNKWEHLAAHSLVYRTSSRSVDRIGQPAIKCTLIIHLRPDLFLRPSFFSGRSIRHVFAHRQLRYMGVFPRSPILFPCPFTQ